MDEQIKIILIIIISVTILGLVIFILVRNYLRNKIDQLVEEEKKKVKINLLSLNILLFEYP